MTLYKWLLADNTTPVQKKPWPCPLGEWTRKQTPILCESGWHGVEAKDVLAHLPKVSHSSRPLRGRGHEAYSFTVTTSSRVSRCDWFVAWVRRT
jgi:hypothetical protein